MPITGEPLPSLLSISFLLVPSDFAGCGTTGVVSNSQTATNPSTISHGQRNLPVSDSRSRSQNRRASNSLQEGVSGDFCLPTLHLPLSSWPASSALQEPTPTSSGYLRVADSAHRRGPLPAPEPGSGATASSSDRRPVGPCAGNLPEPSAPTASRPSVNIISNSSNINAAKKMGRKKIQISRISDERNRQVSLIPLLEFVADFRLGSRAGVQRPPRFHATATTRPDNDLLCRSNSPATAASLGLFLGTTNMRPSPGTLSDGHLPMCSDLASLRSGSKQLPRRCLASVSFTRSMRSLLMSLARSVHECPIDGSSCRCCASFRTVSGQIQAVLGQAGFG